MLRQAIIADIDDPQRRWRYRVFIIGVHREGTPNDALPWAEFAGSFSSKQANDLPHYEMGDTVYVDFLNGDDRRPIITGAWFTNSSDIPDVLVEQVDSYKRARRRWVRADRNGNRLELSELGDENWAALRSGNASVEVTANGNAIRLRSATGPVEVIAKLLSVDVQAASFSARSFELNAEYSLLGVPLGSAALKANDRTIVYGGMETMVGVYVPNILGVPVDTARQSETVRVAPSANLKLGALTGDLLDGVPLAETQLVEVGGLVVRITATTLGGMKAVTMTIEGTTRINLIAPITQVQGDLEVQGTVHATGIITSDIDVKAGITPLAVSLLTHLHGGVLPGGSSTAPPTPV